MALSATAGATLALSQSNLSHVRPSFSHIFTILRTTQNTRVFRLPLLIRAADSSSTSSSSSSSSMDMESTAATKFPKKPVFSLKKGQIVRVDKDKYINSINYLSVDHPVYYKGLDYIYEDRGEVLDVRVFETGEYALIAWVGVPTAPAWLPTDMLIKSEKLNYERM